jgi:2-polyprenyl-3-methyl-5-hydroxy-6-metoxy-1,4-benzoquinol methylase
VAPLLTPRRRRGFEYLDAPGVEPALVERSLADVVRANTLFGGTRAALAELQQALACVPGGRITLLDVGTGLGDIPARARTAAARRGLTLEAIGIDVSEPLVRAARRPGFPTMRADALRLPVADHSVDIVMCSQLLHHFEREQAIAVLRELDRAGRMWVIVSDLRRSWLAAAGIWLASFPLRFHPVSRHDGVVSVLRGFTRAELRELVHTATGRMPCVHDRMGFRVAAVWRPTSGQGE